MIRIVRTARALALVSLVALLATALAQGMNFGGMTFGQARGGATPPATTFAPMGMGANMSMATQTVDEASFLVNMIPHHREAVAAAKALGAVTQRPELLALVDAIVTSQTAEIESMESWLDRWYPDVDRDVAYVPMMRDLGPGAAVADVERAFLEDMLVHHMTAVRESQTLLANGLAENDEVAALARSIVNGQMGEMMQMASWLQAWYGVAAPMGAGSMGMETGAFGGVGFPGGQGMGGYGMMGGQGRGGYGMMADQGRGGYGMMADEHQAMHGGPTGETIGAAEAERLALAFLAGRGEAADSAQVTGTAITYEVVVRIGDAEQVLRVDARTGQVTLESER